eukprot:TRINITY_DN1352_c1_g1_i1.p1 TRINITY_DN1352_c1_g1~~TRINITY_DN1352_c1_g1_i1.p1  ORF type:complete len:531 (+),score=75.72 TRINITY_DN1352_c1_g1_i1:27-1595(+)
MKALIRYLTIVTILGLISVVVTWRWIMDGRQVSTLSPVYNTRVPQTFSPLKRTARKALWNREVFLSLVVAGGLNNQRICLLNGIAAGILANVSVILPTGLAPFTNGGSASKQTEQKSVPLNTYFNIEFLKETLETHLNIHDKLPARIVKVKTHIGKTTSFKSAESMLETIKKASEENGNTTNYIKMKCQFSIDWTGHSDIVLRVLNAITPANKIQREAMNTLKVLPVQFDAVHVRAEPDWILLRADGVKKMLGKNTIWDPKKIALDEIRTALTAASKFPSNRPLYIIGGVKCHDPLLHGVAENLKLLDRIVCGTHAKPLTYGKSVPLLDMTSTTMTYTKAAVDQIIAEHSAVFHGRRESSLSFFVAFARRSRDLFSPSPFFTPSYEVPTPNGVDSKCYGFPCTQRSPPRLKEKPLYIEPFSDPKVLYLLSWFDSRLLSSLPVYISSPLGIYYPVPSHLNSTVEFIGPLCSRKGDPNKVLICFISDDGSLPSEPPDEAFVQTNDEEVVDRLRREGVYAHRWVT